MTWYLSGAARDDIPLASPETAPPAPSFGERRAAATRQQRIEDNSWGYSGRFAQRYVDDLAGEMGLSFDPKLHRSLRQKREFIFSEVARARAADGGAFADVPANEQEMADRLLELRQAEYDDAQRVVDAAPAGSWAAEFAGRAWGALTDEASILTLPVGAAGGARLGVVAVTEAGAAALGEAFTIDRRARVAEELDVPEPSPLKDVAGAAALGGIIGSGLVAGGRAIVRGTDRLREYRAARSDAAAASTPEGTRPSQHEAEIEDAREALEDGRPVAEGGEDPPQPRTGQPPTIADFDFGPSGNASPNKNRVGYVFGKLLQLGYEPHIAAGLVGNFMVESGPSLNSRAVGDGGAAFGIAQWNDRRPALFEFARKRGTNPDDLDTQIAFMHHELRTSEAAAWSKIRTARSAEEAAELVSRYYERPGIPHMGRRVGYARDIYGQYSGGSVPKAAMRGNAGDPPADFDGYTTSRGYTGTGQVSVGDGMRIDVAYEVVDASLLQRASGRFQPRDRGRLNSDAWIADTAARLDPAQLMPAPTADRGAPIVGPDGMIESGNGRFGAIERAYARHPDRAAAYRQQIEAAGYQIPDGVERPVLIARRRTELDDDARAALTVAAQDSGVARMTPTEMAATSARAMTAERLATFQPGAKLGDGENAGFVQSILSALPRSERNAFFDEAGALNAEGSRRLRQAFFARAWDAPDILARYAEAEDAGELRSLMDALEQAAPAWATLRAEIEAGRVRPEFDITPHVLEAMRLIAKAREEAAAGRGAIGNVLSDLLDDVDLLEGALSPLTVRLVGKFWSNGKAAPAKDVAAFLTRYADDARAAGRSDDMLGGSTPASVLRAIDGEVFGDLPDDFGQARGMAPAPAPEVPADLPEAAFAKGADSPEAAAADAEAVADLRAAAAQADLIALVERGGSADEIATHPAVRDVLSQANARPRTDSLPDYGSEAFWSAREYRDGEEILLGRRAATDYLYRKARSLAWTDDGLAPPETIRSERRAVILLGAPAAGKSSIANPYARSLGAAIVDADEAKKIIPEFDGGIGANAVHEESSELIGDVLEAAALGGDNLVLPKVGGRAASIERQVSGLKSLGYQVDLVLVDLPPDAAWRRMIGRFVATGRIIPPEVMQRGIDGAPLTYDLLKQKGIADAYAKIDNTPGPDQPRGVIEDDGGILPEELVSQSSDVGRDGGHRGASHARVSRAGEGEAGRGGGESGRVTPQTIPQPSTAPDNPDAALSRVDDLRAEFSDLTFRLDPNGPEIRAADLLDDIEADQELAEVLNLCNPGGGA